MRISHDDIDHGDTSIMGKAKKHPSNPTKTSSINVILDVDATKVGERRAKLISRRLQKWINGVPKYDNTYLPILACESGVYKKTLSS